MGYRHDFEVSLAMEAVSKAPEWAQLASLALAWAAAGVVVFGATGALMVCLRATLLTWEQTAWFLVSEKIYCSSNY